MGLFGKKDEGKKVHNAAQPLRISKPTNVGTTTMVHDDEYIPNTNNHTQQHARNPNASLNDTVSNHPHQASQANQAPPRPARPQQPAMNTSSAGQSSATGRPRSQDHNHSTNRNSGNSNSSRPSSTHGRVSSVNAPQNNTAVTSQRNSRASTDSRSSTASSSDRDPFELDKYRRYLK